MRTIPSPEVWSVRSFYLRRRVLDLDDLVARPDSYGIDLVAQEEEAVAYVRSLPPAERIYAEGFLRLRIGGSELFGPRLWDYLDQIWHVLTQLGRDVVADGRAEHTFPDQPLPIEATTAGLAPGLLRFTVDQASVVVGRDGFLAQLADHAAWFFEWHLRHAPGGDAAEYLADVAEIRAALPPG